MFKNMKIEMLSGSNIAYSGTKAMIGFHSGHSWSVSEAKGGDHDARKHCPMPTLNKNF